MKSSEVMEIALKSGELMLKSGAEIYRVEETIKRIFKAYNRDCEVFVLLSGIFISTKGEENETISVVRRITERSFDLKRIELANAFSRNICKNPFPYTKAMGFLEGIEKARHYSLPVLVLMAGATAFVYTLLFKGDLYEALAALFVSIITYIVKAKVSQIGFFEFFNYFISGLFVGGASLLAARLFPGLSIYRVIVGGAMIFLPGMAITNGVKDALYGDVVSSLYRVTEAVFNIIGLGAGIGLLLSIAF